LFAVPKDQFGVLADIARETKTPLTLIGEFTQNTNVELSRYGKQVVLSKLGYSHF
jgi:thiamine monophosphate kinase